eukprot:scaffold856_cov30-Attheya_sp.AAC.2
MFPPPVASWFRAKRHAQSIEIRPYTLPTRDEREWTIYSSFDPSPFLVWQSFLDASVPYIQNHSDQLNHHFHRILLPPPPHRWHFGPIRHRNRLCTATRIKVHEGFGPFAKLHPIQSSGTTTGERTGKIVLSSLDKGFRKGIQETGLQGRTGPLNQMMCQVKTTNRIGIQERGSSGRIAPTLDDRSQCLESPGSVQGMFGSGKEGVHTAGGGGNDAPHFFHDGYFFTAQVFLFGQLFHHPPSTNEVGRSIALAKFGFGQFQLLSNPKCRPSVGTKLIFNVFRLTRRPPGQKRMCLQPNVIGIFCLCRILCFGQLFFVRTSLAQLFQETQQIHVRLKGPAVDIEFQGPLPTQQAFACDFSLCHVFLGGSLVQVLENELLLVFEGFDRVPAQATTFLALLPLGIR